MDPLMWNEYNQAISDRGGGGIKIKAKQHYIISVIIFSGPIIKTTTYECY